MLLNNNRLGGIPDKQTIGVEQISGVQHDEDEIENILHAALATKFFPDHDVTLEVRQNLSEAGGAAWRFLGS